MLNSFVQSVSLDVVDHLVGAVRFEIGKSSETPATSEGKSTLPQTTTLPTSETGLGSWSSVALACLGKRRLSCNGLMLIYMGAMLLLLLLQQLLLLHERWNSRMLALCRNATGHKVAFFPLFCIVLSPTHSFTLRVSENAGSSKRLVATLRLSAGQ